jgi:Ca2+:H+ antiporter
VAVTSEESINLGLAVVLLTLFGLYLFFMLKTHPDVFASSEPADAHAVKHSLARSLTTLIVASVGAAIMSEVLVGAVEGTGEALGLSAPFVGIVLLASVGGSAEAASAMSMARKGRIDLALGIALGSCILLALFIAPVLVLASYFVGPEPFDLTFGAAGIGLLFLAILIAAVVTSGGSGHWYKGVQLITVYVMIGLLLYFVPL